uniref:SIR2-like domain-containing protein n=1 Tax=Ignavibacterium album TaxID=591197 RepID=A0A7V3E687_9BACT
MGKDIAFLFGAGVSIPSGIPSTSDITNKVLGGENIYFLTTAQKFIYLNQNHGNDPTLDVNLPERIRKLLRILHNYFQDHYSFMNREINYEDYYNLLDQLYFEEAGEIENPIVNIFASHLFQTHSDLFEPILNYDKLRLIDLLSFARCYIRFIVARELNKRPSEIKQFRFIRGLINNSGIDSIYIFTLNHDLLLERFLSNANLKFSNGFEVNDNGKKVWNKNSYKGKLNLFKLHGSIDWVITEMSDPYNKNVQMLDPNVCLTKTDSPEILIGSMNKYFGYSRKIYFELECLFSEKLEDCDRLIVVGYSFRDKWINGRIIYWLYGARNRKLVVIHKKEEELFISSTGAIYSIWHWDKTERTNLINVIPKWIEEIDYSDIYQYIK